MRPNTTDQEQIEIIKQWWKNYGKALFIALLIGIALGFGWRYWHASQQEKKERASLAFQSMILANDQKKFPIAKQYAEQLISQFEKTPYASLAALLLAREAIGKQQLNRALEQLQWVIQKGRVAHLRQIARIRAARLMIALKKPDDALAVLAVVDDKSFEPLIHSVKGDIYRIQGKSQEAKKFYEMAESGLSGLGINNPMLLMKLAQPLNQ